MRVSRRRAPAKKSQGEAGDSTDKGTKEPGEGEKESGDESGKEQEGTESPDADSTPGEGGESESKSPKGDSSESDSSENGSSGDPSSEESSNGENSKGSPSGQSGEGESGGSDSQSQQQESESFPGQERVRQAEQKMKAALERLAEAKRKEAVAEEEEAARLLAEAKAELEELLRQMREEEIERTLALLESRFRKMLEMELQVYEGTIRLFKIPPARRDRFVDIEAGKLSFQQQRIVVEADKCLALLQEEGSSVAFPESVQQMRHDMQTVESRLGKSQIGRLTQGIEEDIIEALDEMVEALQQAQRDQEERKQQQEQMPAAQAAGEESLVDKIAELKMLKSLQLRINKRTQRYARMLDDEEDVVGQAQGEDLVEALQELAEREVRLQEITHDIVVGRNR